MIQSAQAAEIQVAGGLVDVAADGQCSLIEAVDNANGGSVHVDCTAGDSSGQDVLILQSNAAYTITQPYLASSNGLPMISTEVFVDGNRYDQQ